MKKIALIPIDNRPVCYQLPKMIADINKDIKLIMPDRRLLGSLTKNAEINALFEWLEDIQDVDYIVISADTLIYGGLIPSRRSEETFEDLEQRVLKLRNLLLKKNDCKTFLFSSIMRISNNNINEEEKEYWSEWGTKLFEYSYNLHKFEVEGNGQDKQTAKKLSEEIPPEILVDWLTTRERNFLVNKMYLKMYDDKLLDTLIYSKDDCAKYGFNVKEANYFDFEASKRKNAFVKTGADEIPLTLLARCLTEGKNIKIAPVYTNPAEINLISNYEDISVQKSAESQILTAGASVSDVRNADLIMYVNNFKNHQGELVMDVETQGFDGHVEKFEKPYFAADILNANGSDNVFVEKLFENKFDDKFFGYAGWNTTGNTFGSAISAAICAYTAENADEEAFKKLQAVRFLDDWAYQANVRKYIKTQNITDIGEIKNCFKPYENTLSKILDYPVDAKYSLPWNRFFETEIEL
ncbi:MAG: DUF4127 family protein [Candidatus Gastranaerophilales bacterium]|nr:DUF4127 family protein [Candidatus Gastranaerophilales bacterium]